LGKSTLIAYQAAEHHGENSKKYYDKNAHPHNFTVWHKIFHPDKYTPTASNHAWPND
jgi:hypothetical protein